MKKCWLIAAFALFATQANATIAELVDGVKHRDISAVQNLLKKGENVNATDKDGNTALHYAVAMDNAEMAGVLTLIVEGSPIFRMLRLPSFSSLISSTASQMLAKGTWIRS